MQSLTGSIQNEVPVNPVCPKACWLARLPAEEFRTPVVSSIGEGESQPRQRVLSGVRLAVVVKSRTRSWLKKCPSFLRNTLANCATSWRVEKSPACPVSPCIQRAFSSCTTPWQGVGGLESGRSSVGTHRDFKDSGGLKNVLFMPSGMKTSSFAWTGSGRPSSRSKTSPRSMKPISEYSVWVPGWHVGWIAAM